ncbi:MAG: hypothetical protein GX547_11115 [Phycisphaerae bacterium]|nr:hypothetical protein [Phycisphaerae bacterium]
MRRIISIAALACAALLMGQPAFADTAAISLGGGTMAPMGAPTNHGWQFKANQEMTVTSLGLWDDDDDGMDIEHPVGLWELDSGTLLTSGVISQGTTDPLIDHFRYVDVQDVVLVPGVDYVIGFFTGSSNQDRMVYAGPTDLVIDPAITYVQACYGGAPSLAIPGPTTTTTYCRFGPNFQYIPEPAALGLFLAAGLLLRRRG